MSQEKVDKYKENKANRKEIMRKEKLHAMMLKATAGAIGLVIVGWLGFSVYNSYTTSIPTEEITVNYTGFETYLNTLE
ncbi:MAG: hypothetical protein R3Y58_10705 [Eubacteriales bacterium]